jgi:hypothetical protein
VAEVAGIADDLDVFVFGGNGLQLLPGVVTGMIVDEDVFVLAVAGAGHDLSDAYIEFADIRLLVIAGRNHG